MCVLMFSVCADDERSGEEVIDFKPSHCHDIAPSSAIMFVSFFFYVGSLHSLAARFLISEIGFSHSLRFECALDVLASERHEFVRRLK